MTTAALEVAALVLPALALGVRAAHLGLRRPALVRVATPGPGRRQRGR